VPGKAQTPNPILKSKEAAMSLPSSEILITNVRMEFEQLLTIIRRLDKSSRIQVAQVLAETEMDAKLASLIDELAQISSGSGVSDADIDAEVRAVRQSG
jgi:hypothetical protein